MITWITWCNDNVIDNVLTFSNLKYQTKTEVVTLLKIHRFTFEYTDQCNPSPYSQNL